MYVAFMDYQARICTGVGLHAQVNRKQSVCLNNGSFFEEEVVARNLKFGWGEPRWYHKDRHTFFANTRDDNTKTTQDLYPLSPDSSLSF